jgi:taurine dioxygenase
MTGTTSLIPSLDSHSLAIIEQHGAQATALEPLGLQVEGVDLARRAEPARELIQALEVEMARRGFIVFRNEAPVGVDDFLRASCWWGGRALHSTHGVHPATPGGNRHIFRLSNDQRHGIRGVGPQWHNDGSFNLATFSHSGYHIIRPAENGGGTEFAHQGAAYDVLTDALKARWSRLSSVNSNSGVVHPMVHEHPITGRRCIWLHLGMTGAVIEKLPDSDDFRILDEDELQTLCRQYNETLNHGFENGYAMSYEYRENDCLFIDNLAVAHRASPQAHLPAEQQGLRIMHRSTVRGTRDLAPGFGLPPFVDINAPSPFGTGVWKSGGIGFRWDGGIPMQN